jgi:hypothetical protein
VGGSESLVVKVGKSYGQRLPKRQIKEPIAARMINSLTVQVARNEKKRQSETVRQNPEKLPDDKKASNMRRTLGPIDWGDFVNWVNRQGGASPSISLKIARIFCNCGLEAVPDYDPERLDSALLRAIDLAFMEAFGVCFSATMTARVFAAYYWRGLL